MNKKTFITLPEAITYKDNLKQQGHIATVGKFGLKYRVYSYPPNYVAEAQKYVKNYTELDAKYSLQSEALRTENAMAEALEMQRMMQTNEVYDDTESAVEVAKMLESYGTLKTAKDVFNFLDDPSKFDKDMKEFIDETINEYDYEAKEESPC